MEMFNVYGGIVAIGDNWTRKNVVNRISEIAPDFRFITSIHPNAVIGKDVQIGKGTIIMPGAIVNANSEIRDFCILNTNASLGHDGVMDDFSSMASGVRAGGNFHLGKYSVVCMGVIIIENVRIKEQTVIGAGSLVIKDVGGYVVAYGSPAHIVRKRKAGDYYLSGNRNKTSVLPLMANA
jgi:sugar O-acyltransferase (sialic acid O-acetyltransferase NeuD family)